MTCQTTPTLARLRQQYGDRDGIPLEWVRRDYFPQHASRVRMVMALYKARTPLPFTGKAGAFVVALPELARWLDEHATHLQAQGGAA